MKKKIIVTTAITACIALCAAVWPQAETVDETPIPNAIPTVSTQKATVEEPKAEAKTASPTEKEKTEIPQPEQPQEIAPEPEPVPTETSAAPEVQPTPEPTLVPEVPYDPAPEQATEPPAAQKPLNFRPATWSMRRASAG